MTQSLFTGASGMLAHQRKLDVVANNLANLNTTSYKSQRIQFADLLYNTIQTATGPAGEISGGTNSKQIGQGVNVSQVTKDFTQGILTNTGQSFDFAIQGDGFFVVEGEQDKYTRDGAFGVDANGYLVDPSTGDYVQRFGTTGQESNTTTGETAYQVAGDSRIFIPLGASVAGTSTTESSFLGNLPATAEPPVAEVLLSSTVFQDATSAAATATTTLNDLDNNSLDYATGDAIEISGTNADGSSFSTSLAVDGTTTLGDIVTAIGAELTDATVTLTTDGNLEVTANETGEALLSVNIQDATGNVGQTAWSDNVLVVQTNGTGGDVFDSVIQVFDTRGEAHAIQVSFQKLGDNDWTAEFTSTSDSVELLDGTVADIRFNEDGSFQTINGSGDGDANISLQIDSLAAPQEISISLSKMTHLATSYAATFEQDGFAPGNIVSISASSDGVLTGIATNGKAIDIAQLAIANFSNNTGLESAGQNYYVQTTNSGLPVIGAAETNGSGEVRGGQLESSNVDIALEFTQLIVAQRGFSANARTITIASEVLQELNNIL